MLYVYVMDVNISYDYTTFDIVVVILSSNKYSKLTFFIIMTLF